MRDYIKESNKKSISMEVLLKNLFSTKILSGPELEKVLNKNKELILAATPFMNHLYSFVKESEFFAILCDNEGCVLNVLGHKKILNEASELKIMQGAYMDEANIGTNAINLSILEEKPLQIVGNQHFVQTYHKWTCSVASIKDTNGKIIGCINLTGYAESTNPHTLGMVVAAADAIETMLEIKKYNSMLEISKKHLETTINSISLGILTCDVTGNITSMNDKVVKIFGYTKQEIRKMKIFDFIENWKDVIENFKIKNNDINQEINVNSKINEIQYLLTLYPIYDSELNIQEITLIINEIIKSRKHTGKILGGQAKYTFDQVIGKNEKFIEIVDYAKRVSDSISTILITGESGTGKEVFAQAIHNYGSRKDEPFIAVNCGAIPETLIESELFGYDDGAFTGAKKGGSPGKFEIADGGTIFLDEIGEMPIDMQTKLLRVIQAGVVTRIGSSIEIPINVRIIAATNKNLKDQIEKGKFRKDLYYRVNVLPICLPSLRERKDDIPELVSYYMQKIAKKLNKHKVDIPKKDMKDIMDYDWPGNIRELENVIELIINLGKFQFNFDNEVEEAPKQTSNLKKKISLELLEKQHINNVLKDVSGNITLAAQILGVGRNTLYRKIEKYNVKCSKIEQCSETEQ